MASQVQAYVSAYKTQAERNALARSFTSSGGLNALVGPVHQLNTVAGYTEWKSVGILTVLGAVWALLFSTKLLRGEEDAGRWELLLAGQTTRRGAAVQAISGLGEGLLALFVITAVVTMGIGRASTVHFTMVSSVFFALTVISGAAMFMAGGALASQLAASRRQAAAYGGVALGLFFALRMLADSNSGLELVALGDPLWLDRAAAALYESPTRDARCCLWSDRHHGGGRRLFSPALVI